MITVEEAVQLVLKQVSALPGEVVPLVQANERVLLEDVRAGRNVPPFDNSAMDGFAVRWEDVSLASATNPATLKVLERAAVAVALSWTFDLPIAAMIIATAPGGMAEMTITAQALRIGVPLVVAFHLFRVVMVNMGAQYFYACAAWVLSRSLGR